ncbi:DnaQ-like DNA polymerase III subunit [Gordonia phage Niagara]|uniref:DnaQ-like DNA polymerase III subunit n=2 Tax=Demosthenesvirus katyusha TaxID=1982108 RepID=A0A345MC92_9CAUD|nr:DnaQ-like DNA polymerase III subunit [Gordonia phage Teatealatte]QBP29610.1 DnaQ-like DNA polymerase III subunit [Gordonia phage Tredge]UJD20689.1 DnaQ-like DNA polymerase III subunit [Gordonia phage Niagara]
MTQSVYIDLETTGLIPTAHKIIEVGIALVENYTVVDMFHSLVCDAAVLSEIQFDTLDDVIKEMHGPDGSGILAKLVNAASDSPGFFTAAQVEQRAVEVVKAWNLGKVPVYGSSVHFDRGFLAAHMPELNGLFSHRCVDSSSQMEFVKYHYPTLTGAIEGDPTKEDRGNHDVISDIFFSIDLQRRLDKWVYKVAAEARAITLDSPKPADLRQLVIGE